jgi:signal transduction histidine kinase
MKIRTKLILNYSILSLILLIVFSFIVIIFYTRYRQTNFNTRLFNRSISSVNLFFNEKKIDSSMLRLIDQNIVTAMGNFEFSIYKDNKQLLYRYKENKNTFDQPSEKGLISFIYNGQKTLHYKYIKSNKQHMVFTSAYDSKGVEELSNLLSILKWVLFLSLLLIAAFGGYNAYWSLKPFRKIIKDVEAIEPTELSKRLPVDGSDEISQLSATVNTLLDRVSHTVETEKAFIANASHELRTPVTKVLGQIEVVLNKDRNIEEYKALLNSVYDDTSQMASIINGFLELAQANINFNNIDTKPIAIDELIFSIVDHFEKIKPHYTIGVEFKDHPESDKQLEYLGSERLLFIMFSNIIDNACKFSNEKKAKVTISFSSNQIIVCIADYGIGISKADLGNIFRPLYRGANTKEQPGHGIGLAIVKRIADLHAVKISIESEENVGTTVEVRLNTFSA